MRMYEDTRWDVINSLFVLLGCPVNHRLKAELLNTIAVFAENVTMVQKVFFFQEDNYLINGIKRRRLNYVAFVIRYGSCWTINRF